MGSLVYAGPRSHVMEYLTGKGGWDVTGGVADEELFRRLGLPARPERDDNDPFGEIVYVSATLGRSPLGLRYFTQGTDSPVM